MKNHKEDSTTTTTNGTKIQYLFSKYYIHYSNIRYDKWYILLLVLFEFSLCYFLIIPLVKYTEIDWRAYMEEVEGWWIYGHTNYYLLKGTTGPLVYPAGFLYFFTIVRFLTEDGRNIRLAQNIFGVIYLVQLLIILLIYTKCMRSIIRTSKNNNNSSSATKLIWNWRLGMLCLCLSKRIHSIFVLRLFNDGVAMTFFYLSLYLFLYHRWKLGCFVFSLAVSIKMNILLFAPGLLLLLLQTYSGRSRTYQIRNTILCLSICAITQLILGYPFLTTYPEAYLRKAFEFDRSFFYIWTVNWKFLSEELFLNKKFALLLLTGHLSTLYYHLVYNYKKQQREQSTTATTLSSATAASSSVSLSPLYIAYTLFVSNFIGICFARTLHYQFYSWYFHSLPFMLLCNSNNKFILLLLLGIDYSFSYVFPATSFSSLLLQVIHFAILFGILQTPKRVALDHNNDNAINKKE